MWERHGESPGVLASDGLTEATNRRGEQFGVEGLIAAVEQVRTQPVEAIRDRILEAVRSYTTRQADDLSVVVLRQRGP